MQNNVKGVGKGSRKLLVWI